MTEIWPYGDDEMPAVEDEEYEWVQAGDTGYWSHKDSESPDVQG